MDAGAACNTRPRAAEIIRHTYTKWPEKDAVAFGGMMQEKLLPIVEQGVRQLYSARLSCAVYRVSRVFCCTHCLCSCVCDMLYISVETLWTHNHNHIHNHTPQPTPHNPHPTTTITTTARTCDAQPHTAPATHRISPIRTGTLAWLCLKHPSTLGFTTTTPPQSPRP